MDGHRPRRSTPSWPLKQWQLLRETLAGLGHTVHVLPPEPGLPDMVYAANGAFTVDGTVYGARFRYPQRAAEAAAHRAFYARAGLARSSSRPRSTRARATSPTCPRRTAA